jgi:hypothetical protein
MLEFEWGIFEEIISDSGLGRFFERCDTRFYERCFTRYFVRFFERFTP